MSIAVRHARPHCIECGNVLNAGRICEDCGYLPAQTDLDCQMAIEEIPGAVRFVRPETLRSDGNE